MSDPSATITGMPLTDHDRTVLDLAGRTYLHRGAHEQAIHDELAITPTRYAQRLNALLERPDAYLAEPMLIKRLRRSRDEHRDQRARRRAG